jgi:putative oxidoreductase
VVDLALLLLRGLLALVFVLHGAQKLLPGIGGSSPEREARRFEAAGIRPARELALFTGLLQLGAGALVLVGFLTPLAALALGGQWWSRRCGRTTGKDSLSRTGATGTR